MPVFFIGHGAPLYALGNNPYVKAWRKAAENIPKPKAIVSISAHWLTPGKTLVTATPQPKTIHDFGRMDDRLFEMQYPAPGSPELATKISQTISKVKVGLDHDWGYDHGTWCVLYHMFPDADIPVIQLSIDYAKAGDFHFSLAKELQFLRKKGVLIMASGNIVHNLGMLKFPENYAYDWAIQFDQEAKELMDNGNFQDLVNFQKLGKEAQLSIPTPDHYFPLLYALGLKTEKDSISYPIEGMSYGSTSMRSVRIG
ncbi:unnamed protein product [Cyprideis torosa]|uniref:Extradiol ring-cleavage dioxygenase class III enzyme subunit B domain-containing protein n=1 Tax=Cyprideis torosa TaxID=163714 RepID=A0A7R8WWZ0_9CRUS|nr:unnamed protein product [Cyprideis torosa]CAG0907536.1 unnamed protein product [Cyprideis torosa]